jgi:hypothetical protein
MPASWIGDYLWTHGPLVLASERARKAIAKTLAEPDRKALVAAGKKKQPIVPATIAGHAVYVLPGANHTRVVEIDRRATLLVRRLAHANPVTELKQAMTYEPGWTTEPWKPQKLVLEVPKGGLVLFDAIAQHAQAAENARRAARSIPLGLPAGSYVVEYIAEQKFGRRFSASLLFVHPADHRPPLGATRARPGVPAPLAITPELAKAAKRLVFVSTTGGPLLLVPERVVKAWKGVCNEAGDAVFGDEPTDYDRACEAGGAVGAVDVGGAGALVLGSPDSTALHPIDGGLLLPRWVGADHGAALLAAALGPGKFKPTKLRVTSRGEPWVLMDSSLDGRKLRKARAQEWQRVTLPKGSYTVEVMKEWNGEVVLAGKSSEVMAGAVRLTRA